MIKSIAMAVVLAMGCPGNQPYNGKLELTISSRSCYKDHSYCFERARYAVFAACQWDAEHAPPGAEYFCVLDDNN